MQTRLVKFVDHTRTATAVSLSFVILDSSDRRLGNSSFPQMSFAKFRHGEGACRLILLLQSYGRMANDL